MFDLLLLNDLVVSLPRAVRWQRLVGSLQTRFRCGAVALLQLEGEHLRPLAVQGLSRDALGRAFPLARHPRLAAILATREVVCFSHDSPLPDPYDGLLATHEGQPLPVHDCMGVSLHVDGRLWGALTLDALQPGTFDEKARSDLALYRTLVSAAVRTTQLEQEVQALRLSRVAPDESLPGQAAPRPSACEIVGHSPGLKRLLHELQVVAESDLPVLLTGETGVGKELFARRLHQQSARRHQALIHVNCAALPESLAESELFGHVRGAFCGAHTERAGRFEAADHGTLFLDEVGELPLTVQAKLLRALQNGEIQRLGADRPVRVDVRVVAATNRQLREAVSAGTFRADLYHRLSVYPLPIPPLRERGADVLVLAGHFLELNRSRLGLRSLRLSPEAEDALLRYPWPGNVRELEHVISRAALKMLSRGADRRDIITLPAELLDLDDSLAAAPPVPGPLAPASTALPGLGQPLRQIVEATQREHIRAALAACANNWAQAAALLGLDPSNLHKLARRLALK